MTSSFQLSKIPIQYAKGVGPRRAPLLEKLGVRTVEDALWFIPWRYDNRLEVLPIRNLLPGLKATVRGIVQACRVSVTSRRRLVLVTLTVYDDTGRLDCVFFNQPYLKNTFTSGEAFLLTGTVSANSRNPSKLVMRAPLYEKLDEEDTDLEAGRIIPIYHETQGLSSKQIRRTIQGILQEHGSKIVDSVPPDILTTLGLPALREALPDLHGPPPNYSVDLLNEHATPAHGRLAFEELLLFQLALATRRRQVNQKSEAPVLDISNRLVHRLRSCLPFSLTSAQERVIEEIGMDMSHGRCMNRLLQGDVGCGKTIVALHALVMACGSGYQAVLMAPTEVLSEQHYASLLPYCKKLGIACLLVKGGQAGREREGNLGRMRSGESQIVIGTHALLQPDVQFRQLGLVIIDEQHKFGVLQRARLREKATPEPHVLVMTATPIPRTLAMTLYGDLDVSVIDQFPPGKKPVRTQLFQRSQRKEAYQLLRKELERGRQAYVVFPLVEPSEKVDLHAAVEAADRLKEEFSEFRVGVLHGRLSSSMKQKVMADFQNRHIHVLVSTIVVEVGLDVHNATVMLIEHAERFGLAQLHQLRGRVGRGQDEGYCLLIHSLGTMNPFPLQVPMAFEIDPSLTGKARPVPTVAFNRSVARQRLQVFSGCQDGFALAEEDLKIRGPGQVLGVQQWGELHFRTADLVRDASLLMKAKEVAGNLLTRDPALKKPEHQALRARLLDTWGEKFSLGSVG